MGLGLHVLCLRDEVSPTERTLVLENAKVHPLAAFSLGHSCS